jgi:hypothetical protein
MAEPNQHTFDFLTGSEGDFIEPLMKKLVDVPWARPIIDDINANGGLIGKNKAKLFELRFGNGLHEAGIQPRYEVAGDGESTLDFGFTSGGRDFPGRDGAALRKPTRFGPQPQRKNSGDDQKTSHHNRR